MSAAPDSGTEDVGEGLGADRQAKTQRCERPHDTPAGGETRERVGGRTPWAAGMWRLDFRAVAMNEGLI